MEKQTNRITLNTLISGILFLYILSLYILTYREGYNAISNALAFMVVVSVWIYVLFAKKKITFNKLLLFYVLFIVLCLITSIYAINQTTAVSKTITLTLIFIVMFTLVNYIDSYEKLRRIIFYFVYSGIVSSIYILVTSDFSEITRYGAELGNQNAVGMNIAISSIFCFYIVLSERKYWFTLFLLVMVPCILLTGSRKALILFVLNVIFILYLKNRGDLRNLLKFVLICTCILLVLYYLIFYIPFFKQIIGERVENFFSFLWGESTNEGSMNIRYNMIINGIELFRERPFIGYGIDNYRFLYSGTYSHNNFIELMVGVGIFGIIIYYLAHVFVVKSLLKTSKHTNWNMVCFTFIAIIISYIIISPSLVYYDSKHFSLLLAIGSVIKKIAKYHQIDIP